MSFFFLFSCQMPNVNSQPLLISSISRTYISMSDFGTSPDLSQTRGKQPQCSTVKERDQNCGFHVFRLICVKFQWPDSTSWAWTNRPRNAMIWTHEFTLLSHSDPCFPSFTFLRVILVMKKVASPKYNILWCSN